jgi:hypothetical protein
MADAWTRIKCPQCGLVCQTREQLPPNPQVRCHKCQHVFRIAVPAPKSPVPSVANEELSPVSSKAADSTDAELGPPAAPLDLRRSLGEWRWAIVLTLGTVAFLLVVSGLSRLGSRSTPKVELKPMTASFTARTGEAIRVGYYGRPKELHAILGSRDIFIRNPTNAMVTDSARAVDGRLGRFCEVEILEGEYQGKKVQVEEHDLDLGWSRPKDASAESTPADSPSPTSFVCCFATIALPALGVFLLRRSTVGLARRVAQEREEERRRIERENQRVYSEMREVDATNLGIDRANLNTMKSVATLLARAHVKTLSVKRLQGRHHDDYGRLIEERWNKELLYFYNHIVVPAFLEKKLPHVPQRISALDACRQSDPSLGDPIEVTFLGDLKALVNELLDNYESSHSAPLVNVESLSPLEFESHCVSTLNANGWSASTTKASGDQGIDILATKQGKRAVFQCKKYSSPVGNKAVQEAHAGRSFASADLAFVVSNADFTQFARELASKCNVHLIHYSELTDLDRYL